jgi:hypothetical protein
MMKKLAACFTMRENALKGGCVLHMCIYKDLEKTHYTWYIGSS